MNSWMNKNDMFGDVSRPVLFWFVIYFEHISLNFDVLLKVL
jgi:hypothetical protein